MCMYFLNSHVNSMRVQEVVHCYSLESNLCHPAAQVKAGQMMGVHEGAVETSSLQPHAPRLNVGFQELTGRQPVTCSRGAGGGESPLRGLLCVKTKWPCGCDLHMLLKPILPCFPLPRAASRCTALHRAFPPGEEKGG